LTVGLVVTLTPVQPKRAAIAIGIEAALAAAWAITASKLIFPFGSINHDEPVYRMQADALLHGHLFPVAPTRNPLAFLPWLSVYRDGKFIPKYAPVHPAILALGRLLTGTDRAGLGIIAAASVTVTVLLAHDVLGEWTTALLAGALLILSPLWLLESATYLSYVTAFVLLEALALLVLVALRTNRRRWWVAAGLAGGLAFFARSFDAALFAAPLAVYIVVRTWPEWRALGRRLGWTAVGAAAPFACLLAFNKAATGHVTREPFGLLDASDTVGFGNHRMYPTDPYVHFTPRLGFLGLVRQSALTGFWCFGGLVLIGLALMALWRHGWRSPRWWLAFAGLMIPVGYLFFWGNYGSTIFGLPRYLGPYYYVPVLAPIVVLGAAGLKRLWDADRHVGMVTVVGMLALSLFVAARTVRTDVRLSADDRRLNHGLTSAHLDHALVFLPQMAGPDLLLPFGTAINHYGYTGRVVYALDEGAQADAVVAADFPGRRPYLLVVSGVYRADPPDPTLTSALEPLPPPS
jgi:4-amino-4-deoxy-L-arabinose transferase-like glycosyltransferase